MSNLVVFYVFFIAILMIMKFLDVPLTIMENDMPKTDSRYLINETPWKCILKFSIPLFFGSVIQQVYSISDAAIAGHFIGAEALAAVGSNNPIVQLAIFLFSGISLGANVLISQNYGANNKDIIRDIVDTFMLMIYASSIIIAAGIFMFANTIHQNILGTPEEILKSSVLYMNVLLIGVVGVFGYNGVAACLRALGDSKTPLILLIISNVINITLNLLFVACLKFGIMGLALATSVSQILSFIIGIIFINTKSDIIKVHLFNSKFKIPILKDIISIGLPMGIQGVFVSTALFVIQSLVNSFGVATMAGYNTASRIELVVVSTANNFGQALSVFIAQNVGAGKWDRIKVGVRSTILMTLAITIIISTIIFIFCEKLLMIFTTDQLVINEGVDYLKRISPLYCVAVILFVLVNGIRGSGATLVPMIIGAIGQLGIRIPLAYLLVHIFQEPFGVWYAIPMSWFSGSILISLYYRSGRWKRHVRVKQK